MSLQPTLPRAAYLSPESFAREKELLFAREWVCVGREEEVPNPGDYLLLDVVGESILLLRARDGALRAHYNVCRHRGSQLVLGVDAKPLSGAGEGPTAVRPSGSFTSGIRCPYHAWTYNLDGTLRTAPFLEEGDGFCKEDLPLYRVDVETWGGFVFLRLDTGQGIRPTLKEGLGATPERVRRYPLAALRIGRRLSYQVAANWKVILEN